jgi:hypothetical protein
MRKYVILSREVETGQTGISLFHICSVSIPEEEQQKHIGADRNGNQNVFVYCKNKNRIKVEHP